MRGKVDIAHSTTLRQGITPAYAGKRYCDRVSQLVDGDHPRVCGEKTKKIP